MVSGLMMVRKNTEKKLEIKLEELAAVAATSPTPATPLIMSAPKSMRTIEECLCYASFC